VKVRHGNQTNIRDKRGRKEREKKVPWSGRGQGVGKGKKREETIEKS